MPYEQLDFILFRIHITSGGVCLWLLTLLGTKSTDFIRFHPRILTLIISFALLPLKLFNFYSFVVGKTEVTCMETAFVEVRIFHSMLQFYSRLLPWYLNSRVLTYVPRLTCIWMRWKILWKSWIIGSFKLADTCRIISSNYKSNTEKYTSKSRC